MMLTALFHCSDSPGGTRSSSGGSVPNTKPGKIIPAGRCCVCCHATQETQPKSATLSLNSLILSHKASARVNPLPPALEHPVCWSVSAAVLWARELGKCGECGSELSLLHIFPPALGQRSCLPAHRGLLRSGRLSLCCCCGIFKTHPVAYRFLGVHRWGGPVMTAGRLHCVSYPSKIGYIFLPAY